VRTVYVHSLGCGHRTWEARAAQTGQVWCQTCAAHVSVFVQQARLSGRQGKRARGKR